MGVKGSYILAAGIALATVSSLAGCGGGSTTPPPGPVIPKPPSTPPATNGATLSVVIPAGASAAALQVQSVFVAFASSTTGQVVGYKVIEVGRTFTGCTSSSASSTTCVAPLQLSPGTYIATVDTYNKTSAKGTRLSQGQQAPFTLATGAEQVSLALGGSPGKILIRPQSSGIAGSQAAGYTFTGTPSSVYKFFVNALDATGNTIVGPSAPVFSVSSSNASFGVAQPTATAPNIFSVTLVGLQNATASLTASSSIGGTLCTTAGCTGSAKVGTNPFAADDWLTFAHDSQRTGQQTQPTGITPANVSQLKQRWATKVQYDIFPSLDVYNGNIIVAAAGTIYDLSAATGQIIWSTVFNGGMDATPAIDTDDGLVFVGNRVTPGIFEALRLSDGSVAWSTTLPGTIRSSPVYAKGVVYEGWAGGDPPACLNGGIKALDAKTGAVKWTWLTNPLTNPGGGGGVWGALAYDGTHVFFGTGNTCTKSVNMQGAVAVNLNGTTDWAFVADPQLGHDDDTGGGVMVTNGNATFLNKNGTLYNVDIATGKANWSSTVNPREGFGGFGSPGTDGSITVIGAGEVPTPAPAGMRAASAPKPINLCKFVTGFTRKPNEVATGFTSKLVAVGPTGAMMWSIPMQSRIDAYPAINNDIAFIGMDTKMDAIDIRTGAILWSFTDPSGGLFNAGAVVVPSGLYIGDSNGNVYAFSLPASAAAAFGKHVLTRR